MNGNDLTELLQRREELDPELAEYFYDSEQWPSIKHPLVFSIMHHGGMNAFVNQQLKGKKEALARAEAEQEWHTYIYLHERPYRVDAFLEIMGRMSDVQYWHNLASIWMDSENIRQSPQVWQRLLRSKRPNREEMMDNEDLCAFDQLPGLIPVYQGHTAKRHDGWSWTTDKAKAEWFAQRFSDFEHSAPVVTKGVVLKRNVIAYLTGRGEYEVIADRRNVKERKSTTLRKDDQ